DYLADRWIIASAYFCIDRNVGSLALTRYIQRNRFSDHFMVVFRADIRCITIVLIVPIRRLSDRKTDGGGLYAESDRYQPNIDLAGNRSFCHDGIYRGYLSGFLRYWNRDADHRTSDVFVDRFAPPICYAILYAQRSLIGSF